MLAGVHKNVLLFKNSHEMDVHTIDKIFFLASVIGDPDVFIYIYIYIYIYSFAQFQYVIRIDI